MITLSNIISLRKPEYRDIADLLLVKNNNNAKYLLGGNRDNDYTSEDIKNWIDFHNNRSDEILYVIYECINQCVIGHVALYNIDNIVKKAEFGILIGNEMAMGKGYGSLCLKYMLSLAFNELNLNRIELNLLSENIPAFKLYEKYGFKTEGLLRSAQYKNNRYYDIMLMSILKNEYVK